MSDEVQNIKDHLQGEGHDVSEYPAETNELQGEIIDHDEDVEDVDGVSSS